MVNVIEKLQTAHKPVGQVVVEENLGLNRLQNTYLCGICGDFKIMRSYMVY